MSVTAQPKCYFEHYGTEDGLPQHTVMDILQDKRGFIWVSTWNGLCKFDGYNFFTYKIQQGDSYHMRSNRIDHIFEDIYGNIWTLSYDKDAHRFNPKSETFMGLKSLQGYEDVVFPVANIIPTESGKVWILSEKNGCVCVVDSMFRVEPYNVENGRLRSNVVHTVYEDKLKNTWVLTDNGLTMLPYSSSVVNMYFSENDFSRESSMQSFYSVLELPDEIWFGSSKGRLWRYNKRNGEFYLLNTQTDSKIIGLHSTTKGEVVLLTDNNGFFTCNISDTKLQHYTTNNLSGLCSNNIVSGYVDRFKNLWLQLDCFGVAKFNCQTKQIKHFLVKQESFMLSVFPPNFFIFEDKDNRLWVHPRGGGFSLYDRENDLLEPFYNEPGSPNWRFSNMMHAAFCDRQGNLWLSTRSHGLEKVIFDDEFFTNILVEKQVHSLVNNDVRAVFEDIDNNLWVSTKSGKVYVYDKTLNNRGYLCKDGRIGQGDPLLGVAYCIAQDKDKNIWIGTRGNGLYKVTYNEHSKKYNTTHYKNNPSDIYSLSDDNIYTIFPDKKGRIWVGTYGGGLNYIDKDQEGRFFNYRNNLKKYPVQTGSQVRTITADKNGNICVGTTVGLIVFSSDFDSPENIEFKNYLRVQGDNSSLSGNDVFDILTTKTGITYIATFGGGLNKVIETDKRGFPSKFKSYTTLNGLPSDVILSIVEAKSGDIWICSENNLSKFDSSKETFDTFSGVRRLMKDQNFSEASRCVLRSGNIVFGHSKGLMVFNPDNVKNNDYDPYLALINFRLFNKDVQVGSQSFLPRNLDYTKELVLKHNQNFFTIEFATLDYVDPKNIKYAYKLDGFDKDWIYAQNQRVANYTNLSKGSYVFKVRSTNSDGVWIDNERSLPIIIKPSFWDTPWAYLIYFVLLVGLSFLTLRTIFLFYRMKDKVELEHQQTEMKARFFTDISHEIRTPLTMIVSPIENILNDEKTPSLIKNQLQLVSKNTTRLLDMVNQILDFRKIRQQELHIEETNLGLFVKDICCGFQKMADDQNILFSFHDYTGEERIWVDQKYVEKMVVNLLSNAFKYTPENKSIEVNVYNVKSGDIAIEVKDEGIGISKEKQSRLFKRFESFNEDKNKPSTGIGLSMVKELADKHKAKIQVDTALNEGSSFIIIFSKDATVYGDDVVVVSSSKTDDEENILQKQEPEVLVEQAAKPTVLIVEDDQDLRGFIRATLESEYFVYEAEDGEDGMQKALDIIPDFIVSDIMMPNVDGMEFLQKIRENINTSHILFLLLTAKTTLDSKLDGLEHGADDYLTKPFSVSYLRARVRNLLDRRLKLQDFFQKKSLSDTTSVEEKDNLELEISSKDESFMNAVIDIIEKNMDNPDFIVEDLANEMGMSRTVFFKKIKSLTGLAPIEFIRDVILQRAAELLRLGQYSVKEISYMVGMSDAKYFSKCFKKKYNKTPSEYRKEYEK